MKTTATRREFVGSVSAAALCQGAGLSALAPVGRAAEAGLTAEPLAEGLVWIRGAGANLLALKDPQGLVFIDGGLKTHADAVLKLAETRLGRGTAHSLINTHWHAEHTGLNEQLGKAGATIIAHEHTRLWLSTTVRYQPDGPPIRPLPKIAQPNKTSWTGGDLAAGSETLQYAPMSQAHTDGDLYVKLARANVLVTGGVVFGNGWPTPDWVTGGAITGTVNGYRSLIAQCDDATRVVTAYGERLYTKSDLQAELDIISRISGELSRMMRAGFGPADMLAAAPAKDHVARLGDPTVFLVESFKSLWPRLAPDA
ncbi:MAG TPA: MBL fold metallo-hydrolase [Steroidobacteraceae bacterium]|nr:MBL fold metallo-hydrolase [Steroidobacteraceae bacterium]